MADITYPTRCQIVNADGLPYVPIPGMMKRTPNRSLRHIGKKGLAEEVPWPFGMAAGLNSVVKITLDDGAVIYGHECWWVPIEESKDA